MHVKKATLIAAAVAAIAAAGITPALADATPSQTSTVTVDASAATPVDTGVVANSQFTTLTITASGTSTFDSGVTNPGPNGAYPCPSNCILDGAPVGALLAKIDSGAWQVVGSGPTTLTWNGKVGRHLYLAYNDVAGTYGDNSGTYTVSIVRSK